jgi:acetyl-CoA carboxylase biotin carboxyl carrier protein
MAGINEDDLRWLLELLEEEALAEIEVHEGEAEILVRSAIAHSAPEPLCAAPLAPSLPPVPTIAELGENEIPVLSPMSGVFYATPTPGAPAFVKIGDHVEHGDTVGLVEAMKLFSEVPAPTAGTVVRFLVEHQHPVEADQCLMIIERTRH